MARPSSMTSPSVCGRRLVTNTNHTSTFTEPDEAHAIWYGKTSHSNVPRLRLRRPLARELVLGNWTRIDVEIVSEMGLCLPITALTDVLPDGIGLIGIVLQRNTETSGWTVRPNVVIDMRPLPFDAWDNHPWPSWPGCATGCCQGGCEIKLNSALPTSCIVGLFPVHPSSCQPLDMLPLALGPCKLVASTGTPSSQHRPWDDVGPTAAQHRIFSLPTTSSDQQLLLFREDWQADTSGKVWDAALTLASMLTTVAQQYPQRLAGRRLLDFSAGTGMVGLCVSNALSASDPMDILFSDQLIALDRLRTNVRLNHPQGSSVSIWPLEWGHSHEIQAILATGPIDIIIASDVVYNACHVPSLIDTLRQLCTPRHTVIYLGYRRRGFSEAEEADFVQQCQSVFDMHRVWPSERQQQHYDVQPCTNRLGSLDDVDTWINRDSFPYRSTSVMIYRLMVSAAP